MHYFSQVIELSVYTVVELGALVCNVDLCNAVVTQEAIQKFGHSCSSLVGQSFCLYPLRDIHKLDPLLP